MLLQRAAEPSMDLNWVTIGLCNIVRIHGFSCGVLKIMLEEQEAATTSVVPLVAEMLMAHELGQVLQNLLISLFVGLNGLHEFIVKASQFFLGCFTLNIIDWHTWNGLL